MKWIIHLNREKVCRKEERLMLEVPIWEKYALSIEEAAEYFGIGQKKIRKIVEDNPTAEFILKNGAFTKIKRGKFEWFLDQTSCI